MVLPNSKAVLEGLQLYGRVCEWRFRVQARAPHHNASLSEGLAGRLFSDGRERGGVSVPCTHGHAVTAWLPSRVPYTQPPLDAYLWQLCAYVPRITLRPSVTVYQILQSHSTVCAINNEIMQFSNHGELLMTV